MADLMTIPHAWIRTLTDTELDEAIARSRLYKPQEMRSQKRFPGVGLEGIEKEIDGSVYSVPIGWLKFEKQVRAQLAQWTKEAH